VSRRAVICARVNARLNGLRLRALRGDMFEPVGRERFDLIVANPPYLPALSDADPRGAARAWDAGTDGRVQIDRLCREAADHLTPGGELLLVQSSICDPDATARMLEQGGLRVELVAAERGALGPLLAARAPMLEARGLLAPGEREEEVVVLSARSPAKTGTVV
jgi:release factor glutamine methyltransferase